MSPCLTPAQTQQIVDYWMDRTETSTGAAIRACNEVAERVEKHLKETVCSGCGVPTKEKARCAPAPVCTRAQYEVEHPKR